MPGRILWVDYAKATGVVLVVYGHVVDGMMKAGIMDDSPIHDISLSVMPLFFFLSGLFFAGSLHQKGRIGLFRNKLDSLIYPFVIWCVIDGGLGVILSDFTNRNTSWADVFSMFWAPRGQFWFLYTLFLLFVISIPIFAKLPRRLHWVILVIAGILYVFKNVVPPVYPLDSIAKNWVFFVFGICFSPIKNLFFQNIRIIFPFALLVFLSSQQRFHFKLELLSKNAEGNGLALFTAFASILFIVSLCMVLSRFEIKPLILAGTFCLEIYLMHVMAGSGFRILLAQGFGVHDASMHLIPGTLSGIAVPMAAGYFLKRANIHFLFTPVRNFKPSAIFDFPYRNLSKDRRPGR